MNTVDAKNADEARLPVAFGLDPAPIRGGGLFSPKPKRSLYVSSRHVRQMESERLEPWLRSNGWTSVDGAAWTHDRHGVLTFARAIWTQLCVSWHEKIALEASRRPRITRPPFPILRDRFGALARDRRRELAREWLSAHGAEWRAEQRGWVFPGERTEYTDEEAYRILFHRWLTHEAELLGWDWAGICGHPHVFKTPDSRKLSRRAAIRALYGPP